MKTKITNENKASPCKKIIPDKANVTIEIYTYPNSSNEELICCASFNRSPEAPVLLILSLPAKSQLKDKQKYWYYFL